MDAEKNNSGRKIPFEMEDGTQVEFYVLEQTRFYGVDYLLVAEDGDLPEAQALILKVEDENELRAVAALFEELLEDVDIL